MTKGDRIRNLREGKQMTQEELAKLLDTKRQTISKYEKGIVTNIPSDRLEAMAEILDTTPEYILGWETVQKNNDAIVDIVVRLRNDSVFLELVDTLNRMDEEKILSVKNMLSTLLK